VSCILTFKEKVIFSNLFGTSMAHFINRVFCTLRFATVLLASLQRDIIATMANALPISGILQKAGK